MSILDDVLRHLGFEGRRQQSSLYEELRRATTAGVIAQAGTGTGKSLAVLSAAVDWNRYTGSAVAVATPTKLLMDQYAEKDAPAVAAATGARIVTLKGRLNYLCEASVGFRERDPAMRRVWERLHEPDVVEVVDHRFGCRGSRTHPDKDTVCHARRARERAQGADVVVTNLHLLVLAARLAGDLREENPLLPPLGALFVDEAHTLEAVVRGFFEVSISSRSLRRLPEFAAAPLREILDRYQERGQACRVEVDRELVRALIAASGGAYEADDQPEGDEEEEEDGPVASALHILGEGRAGRYDKGGTAVLHFVPADPFTGRGSPRLVSTWINLAGPCGWLLTQVPTGLVSATIPRSMRSAVGLGQARVVDVGHPFDYARQATIRFSDLSGAFRAVRDDPANFEKRVDQVVEAILATRGGALVLFSSMRDLRQAHDLMRSRLGGRQVLVQTEDSDRRWLARRFREDGRAVLLGSETYAAGLDVPGDALTLVVVWKLPYPGIDPVVEAIKSLDYQRYEDMMLVRVAQAIGRLIRTTTDVGEVFVVDSRGRHKLLGSSDPLIRHINSFCLVA